MFQELGKIIVSIRWLRTYVDQTHSASIQNIKNLGSISVTRLYPSMRVLITFLVTVAERLVSPSA